ncbi:tail assembly protein [Pseudomonas protegens]|uniref:tail assembly protein n=1 Tax=Pseudomonas protegens TaxID=380021 RepID=UPI002772561D|nr:tail assembly protein [Pseudomonas protegens]MDP9528487.1 tail assembly protein [Pseudomonas protegens]
MAQIVEKMQTIRLSGSLGRVVGQRDHTFITTGGWKDIAGYFKQFPAFDKHIKESAEKGMRYALFVGRENIGQEDLGKPTGRQLIRIIPVIQGAKRAGLLQTVIGVAIIALAWWNPLGWSAAAVSFGYATGASMAIGGVVQMLSPQPKGLSTQDGPNNRPSYSFNGAVNTSVQGNPVPLLYGRMIVGSAVISAGIYSEDQM